MKQVLFAALLLYSGNMAAQNRSNSFDSTSLERSIEKAKSDNRLIFIDCYTSWCGPCKEMSKHVFTQDSVADFFNAHFVNVKLDMEKGEGPAVQKEFHVEAFPTYLLLNGNRKLIYRFVGGMPADTFLARIKKGMDTLNRMAILNERYNNGERTKELLQEYIKIKIEGMEISVGEKVAAEYFEMLTQKEKVLPENWFLFGENRYSLYLSNVHSRTFQYMADHWREFARSNGKKAVENKMRHMYQRIAEYCLNGWYFKDRLKNPIPYDKKEFDRYRAQIKSTDFADKDQLLALVAIAQAAAVKDTAKVTALMKAHIGGFSAENQQVAFAYVGLFNSSQKRSNPDFSQILETIIQSNRNENLVRLAKSYVINKQ
jgi:thiol-disulfide isomerase/thioredoxin